MNEQEDDVGYTVSIRPRGGSGSAAMWQWEVCESGKTLPIEKGVLKGAESKAYQAGKQAIARLLERQAAKAKSLPK
jgi:hypothetical protein